MLNSHRARHASARTAAATVAAAALVLAGVTAAWAAAGPIIDNADIQPANILFSGVSVVSGDCDDTSPGDADICEASGTYTDDAYDGYGFFTLDPGGDNVPVEFNSGDCVIDGTTDAGVYVSDPTVLTCTQLGVVAGGGTYNVTVARSFMGSWALWSFAADLVGGSGPLQVEFTGNLGSDSDTTYYPGNPSAASTAWVSGDGGPSTPGTYNPGDYDPVLFTGFNSVNPTTATVEGGSDDVTIDFEATIENSSSFVLYSGVVDYNINQGPAAYDSAVCFARGLTTDSFGGELLVPAYSACSGNEGTPPPSWYQGTGRDGATAQCPDGWSPSWNLWPHGGTGGFTCDREEYWDTNSGGWAFRSK
jgi:hypothetical protein